MIDVWQNSTETFLWKMLKLTMESSSYNFTFECDCWIGNSHNKTTISPKEDMWALKTTTGSEEPDGDSKAIFGITVWDSTGVSNTVHFHGVFELGENVTLYLTIHVNDPVRYQLWQDSRRDYWECKKRRIDGDTYFYRGFDEYRDGFGDVNHEFWLGNEQLHALLFGGENELRVDMEESKTTMPMPNTTSLTLGTPQISTD
ncbi:ryncolin-4-like [Mizuhopecten yessoensis]|uniref:ryncolin-4-like n=1 Tax=Mizuhopecten yessoensis TaxID=6573 RepID=UPI000B45C2DE|nr:ryncolin-4-like [Mizuhopecten yessoensis]